MKEEAIIKTKKKEGKKSKPIYEKAWFWVVAIIGGLFAINFISGLIGAIVNPDISIPDVKGLTKKEACEKIEKAGFVCKTGSYYDSNESNQRISDFHVTLPDGGNGFDSKNSMRAKRGSVIEIDFEKTEKQKAEEEKAKSEELLKSLKSLGKEDESNNPAPTQAPTKSEKKLSGNF